MPAPQNTNTKESNMVGANDGWTKMSGGGDVLVPPAKAKVEHAAPPSAEPLGLPPARALAENTPGGVGREPKHRLGAFLKIPGGFSGRVVRVYRCFDEVVADPEVQAAGGPERVLRGLQGTGLPTTKLQPFYRCTSNRVDYDLVVGELDSHLISQGPDGGAT
jgi:hypothetical protein